MISINILKSYIRLLRPYQWIKNILLFSPLFFSGRLENRLIYITAIGTLIFSLVSGLGYTLNDWLDRENDRFHPEKKTRPFPSGGISGQSAVFLSIFVLVIIAILLFIVHLPDQFFYYLLAYAVLTITYSFYLKKIVILEIFMVSIGFVIRVFSGGAICGIVVSSWLFFTVFFIAMMISAAKRVTEHKQLGKKKAALHRKSHSGYSLVFLNSMLWACGSITLVVYALYALEHGRAFMFSVIPAAYGVMRFIYLTDLGKGADPIKALFADKQLLLTTCLFFVVLGFLIYRS